MAFLPQHAMENFVKELNLHGVPELHAKQYASLVVTLSTNVMTSGGNLHSVADSIRACLPQVSLLKPIEETEQSAEVLTLFRLRLEEELNAPISTIFNDHMLPLGQGQSLSQTSRVPKQSVGNLYDGAVGGLADPAAEIGRHKRARTVEQGAGASMTVHGSDVYVSQEADMPDAPAASRAGAGAGAGASSSSGASPDSPYLQFLIVKNDGSRRNLVWLTQVKNIFAAQLPKMPREYIARLVFDRKHRSMLVVKKDRVVGGICFRPFLPQGFAEIAFCAITASEQVKGYGTRLMNHLKEALKMDGIQYFLTYADNYAIGYFKKQGFSKYVTLQADHWVQYIKEYDGGTLMECKMMERVNYLDVKAMTSKQSEKVISDMSAVSRSNVVHPSLHTPEGAAQAALLLGQPVATAKDVMCNILGIPGVKEAGWTQAHATGKSSRGGLNSMTGEQLKTALTALTKSVIAECPDSWPFHTPVDEKAYPDYRATVKEPMDLTTMLHKVQNNAYRGLEHWRWEGKLMTNNARLYNRPDSEYAACATRVDSFIEQRIRQPMLWVPNWNLMVMHAQALAQQAASQAGAQARGYSAVVSGPVAGAGVPKVATSGAVVGAGAGASGVAGGALAVGAGRAGADADVAMDQAI